MTFNFPFSSCYKNNFENKASFPIDIDFDELKNLKYQKERLIVLTDINTNLKEGKEQDDVQSLVRLLTYSNEIDIEGIIACTSCWLKKGAREHNLKDIYNVIDAYEKVKPNLDIHAKGYPTADYLRSISCCGIQDYGKEEGDGFANIKYKDNKGVKLIIDAVDKEDDRPIWFSIWGGSNTLAQAIWQVKKDRSCEDFNKFISKIRVYSIFDQDVSGKWIRDNFGDKIYYIVTPTPVGKPRYYDRSTSASISNFIDGADNSVITNEWIKENIQSKGELGNVYPNTVYIEEGDTPSFLHLIQNGLNIPGRIEYGSWGGRWINRIPNKNEFKTKEKFKFYTQSSDSIIGVNGKNITSNEATLFRWRGDFQNDFANRLQWSITSTYSKCNHAPIIEKKLNLIEAKPNENIKLTIDVKSMNNNELEYAWIYYKEVGNYNKDLSFKYHLSSCEFIVPLDAIGKTFSFIVRVTSLGKYPVCSYARFFIRVSQ